MKNKKTILQTLANRSFRTNKTRNLVAVIAIVMTTLMFTSLFVLSQSMVKNMQDMNMQQAGFSSHLSFDNVSDKEIENIAAHKDVRELGVSTVVGIAENSELNGRQIEIRQADQFYAQTSFSLPTTGTMPQKANEIALDTITLDKLGIPYELGQSITLKWRKDMAGQDYITSTFVLSGFWNGNSAALASMAWVSEDYIAEVSDIGENGQYFGRKQLHVNVGNDKNLEQVGKSILADIGAAETTSVSANFAFDSSMKQNIMRELLPMVICVVLVFISGYLIIYNIFQISVATDIRFYGKLKTLGTSKRQLKKMIYGQANRLSLIAIPIGLLLGYFLGTILVPLVIYGNLLEATVEVNPFIFIGSAIFAWMTVLISCMKPAKLAGKVSPMEALRYTDSQTNIKKKMKKGQKGSSLHGMALANLGRNKKRTVTVICSLTLGLVLLTGLTAKNSSFDIEKYMSFNVISDFEVKDSSIATNFGQHDPYGTTISDKLVNQIETLSGLESTGHLYSQSINHVIGASALQNIQTYFNADERLVYMEATDAETTTAYHEMLETGECSSVLYGIDGLILDTFSQDYRIIDGVFEKEKFQEGGYVMVEASSGAEESEKEIQPTYAVGDTVTLGDKEYVVMGIIANITPITEGVNSGNAEFLSFYLPTDEFKAIYPDNTIRKFFFNVAEEKQTQAEQMLLDYQANEDKSMSFESKNTLIEHYKSQTRSTTVMALSISLIIAFVGILNFINSMVTAIVSRQKEFAMIQSIGMTKYQLRKMLIYEGLFYAGFTLLASYVLGSLAVGVGVRAMVANDWSSTFHFTIMALVYCTPIIIAFAVFIPYLCCKNIEKQSLVERLRATD
ncbi:MAG: ABC transporter permease [Anaerostipes sp.]|nr:ABC transporter permease [Anaerostipes sp.]